MMGSKRDHLVDFSIDNVVKVKVSRLEEFKQIAQGNIEKKRYRLCLHDSPDNSFQEMFICRARGDYGRPDKHNGIPESHTIIEGRELIVLFSDVGDITDEFILDKNNGYLSYRINASIYHMTIPLSDFAIDYEIKLGPFTAKTNIFPEWAPDGTDLKESLDFMKTIESMALKLLNV